MSESNNQPKQKNRLIGFGVTIASYFLIKYGLVARFFASEDYNNLLYSIILIIACMFLEEPLKRHWIVDNNKLLLSSKATF